MAATVAAAVYRVQVALFDGAATSNEPLLHAAAALLSRPDYDDVVTERSIADACGHPLCASPLPPQAHGAKAQPRFHISLREHRVYDLEEARKFCSERCLVASAAFAASLPPKRPYGVPPERLQALVALFEGRGDGAELGFQAAGAKEGGGEKVLEIREKEAPGTGEVTLQEWIGASDAIEGYVPRHGRNRQGPKSEAKHNNVRRVERSRNKSVDSRNAAPGEDGMTISSSVQTRVSAEVITKKLDSMVLAQNIETNKRESTKTPLDMFKQDEDSDMLSSCISDSIAKQLDHVVLGEKKEREKKKAKVSPSTCKSNAEKRPIGSDGDDVDFRSTIIIGDRGSTMMNQGTVGQYNLASSVLADKQPSSSQHASRDSMQSCTEQLHEEFSRAVNIGKDETSDETVRSSLKSSLRAAGSKNRSQSVQWADEIGGVLEVGKTYESHSNGNKQSEGDNDNSLRHASAEACAAALTEAAEAISIGTSGEDAVSQAGIIILLDKEWNEYDTNKDAVGKDTFEIDNGGVKWPKKPVLLDTDMFEVDDSWHDTPPEGFGLTLSAFASMWSALFGWVSRSSLAYVYGLDESSVEELLIADGREYPQKIVLKDGQSAEIRRALDTCVCNAVPALISSLRMQIPVSKLEIKLGYLICTMSFVDALPSLRSKQWQVMVLVLIDALSTHQLPGVAPVMSDLELVQKVLNSAQVSKEEYSSMVDLLLPFGRSIQMPMS